MADPGSQRSFTSVFDALFLVLLSAAPKRPAKIQSFGPVAQLVEQRIENPRVGSSILPQATIHKAFHVIALENH